MIDITDVLEEISTVKELKADERGRVNLGTDYADKTVRVAVFETSDEGE